jgi:hypothetical protein
MSTTVTFCIETFVGPCLEEDQLEQALEVQRERLLSRHIDGYVILRADGQPEVRIEDELPATVQNLCFGAIGDLLADRPVTVSYYSMSGQFQLEPTDRGIRINGDMVPSAVFDQEALVPALYACGQRFVQYLRLRASDDPGTVAVIQHLQTQEAQARAALAAAGLLDVSDTPAG